MNQEKKDPVVWFSDLRKTDIPIVGGKNANLGEMINAGIPVPPGFAITAQAYEAFLVETRIAEKVYQIIKDTITDLNDPKQYDMASKKIRTLIETSSMPKEIESAIKSAYKLLCKKLAIKDVFVAVRSSATAEDLPDASFAGQQETFLNIRGTDNLIDKVMKCWSSLFTPRAIFYRNEKGFPHEKVLISVGVQKMVNSRAAGVIFTINPVTGNTDELVIDGNYGLGETVVSGAVNPDDFVVDKSTLKIKERRISKKTVQYVRDPRTGETVHLDVPEDKQKEPCVSDDEVLKLSELATRIERHYGKAMDIEWAIDQDLPFPSSLFAVQARPETVWSGKKMEESTKTEENKPGEQYQVVTKGISAGKRGYGVGIAKVVLTPDEASRDMRKGNILVTDMTNPDFVPFMKIASAIITDKGGVTSHAAIVSRELAIPCIVGTENATKVMKTGKEYTVDSRNGIVYEGVIPEAIQQPPKAPGSNNVIIAAAVEPVPVTATKIYMNLAIPEKIEEYKNLPFQGIGLMRDRIHLCKLHW